MVRVRIKGEFAQYTVEKGWISNDAMLQKWLRDEISPKEPNDTDATKLLNEQFPEGAVEFLGAEPKVEWGRDFKNEIKNDEDQ